MIHQPTKKFEMATKAAELSLAYDLKAPEGQRKFRTMAAEKYVRHYPQFMDTFAAATTALEHMYELGHRGEARYRLFKMIRSQGNLSIVIRPAKMQVPLSAEQREPGPTGRVVTKRFRFPARPFLYEFGATIVIKRRPGTKFMWTTNTWPVPPQRGPIVINTRNGPNMFAFRNATKQYFRTDGRMVMNSVATRYAKTAAQKAKRAMVATNVR